MQSRAPEAGHELSPAARRQGLVVLVLNNLLMWTGFIMVVPLLAVHYVDGLGWPAAAIGMVLAVRQLTQQGLGVFAGMLADRFSVKGLIMLGLLLRALGFGMMAWATNVPLLLLSAIFAALGGALFDSPSRAAVILIARPEERSNYFAIESASSSIGTAVGPLAGALLLSYSFELVALTAASFYIVACIMLFFWLPIKGHVEQPAGQQLASGLTWALKDRIFMLFTTFSAGMWFVWVQFSVALPLQATTIAGTAAVVSWIYLINAALSLILQYPAISLLSRRLNVVPILAWGTALMACGLGSIAFAHTTSWLLVGVTIYICGSLLAMPSQQTAIAELANPAAIGSYYGVGALSLAAGGSIGNLAGGLLYDWGQAFNWPALPWIVFWGVGLAAAGGLFWLQRRRSHSASQALEPSQSTFS
jgi:DHA1 family multidrug resistance protein-like MFS transporter